MTKAQKQSLMLIIAIALIMFLTASVIGMTVGSAPVIAEEDDSTIASGSGSGNIAASGEDGAIDVRSLMINGNVPGFNQNADSNQYLFDNYASSDAQKISTVEGLKDFLQNSNSVGYLTNNIENFSWDGSFTNLVMPGGKTLDGCGYTITMNASSLNTSSPWTTIAGDFRDALTSTFVEELTYDDFPFPESVFDLNGGLVGYLPSTSTIKNVNFVYTGTVSGSYSSKESGSGAIIAATSSGTIDNCSLTLSEGSYFDVSTQGNRATLTAYQEMARHSYAIGGYVGLLSNNGVVANSKITLEGGGKVNSNISNTQAVNTEANISAARSANRDANVRVWGGGIAGWMGNGASVYNITTAGSGNITAVTGFSGSHAGDNPLSYAGIVAGTCAIPAKNTGDKSSVVGNIASAGSIDGVINTWKGRANYIVGSDSTRFSPINQVYNSIASQVCGLSGNEKNKGSTVSNVYFMYDESAISNSSVTGYNFATEDCGMSVTRIYIMDYDEKDGYYNVNNSEKAANAYLTFASQLKTANVLAIYYTNLASNPGAILWQVEVNLDTVNNANGTVTNFYEKLNKYDEASKYELTYTEIARTHTSPTEIKYQLGKIVYYEFSFDNITATPEGKNYRLADKEYDGARVIIPNIKVYDYTDKYLTTIEYNSDEAAQYWVAKKADDMNLYTLSDTVAVGEYEYFVYKNYTDKDGKSLPEIDLLDTTNRYVAYRQDNPNYPVDDPNVNDTNWQPRMYQKVTPKNLDITLNAPQDFAANNQYDGEAVLYSSSINTALVGSDVVNVDLKYYTSDGTAVENNAAINSGSYYVEIDSLSNSNYTYNPTRVDFTIAKRMVTIEDNTGATIMSTEYALTRTYTGLEQPLSYAILADRPADPSEDIIIYNVLAKDSGIINVYYNGDMKNAGTYTVDISLNDGIAANNYSLASNVKYTVTIAKADVQILLTETEKSIIFGELNSTPGVTVTGVNDEVIVGEWYYVLRSREGVDISEYTRGIPSVAGSYLMVYYVGGDFGTAKNYNAATSEICYYTIAPRDVTIYFDEGLPTQYEYTGAAIKPVATYETQNNETNTGILGIHVGKFELKYSFVKDGDQYLDEAIDVGTYTADVVLEAAFDMSSYNIIYAGEVFNFTITPKAVTVNIADAEKTYGDEDPEFTWAYGDESTFAERDNIVLNLTTTAGKYGNVGTYDITCTSSEGNIGNYDITYDTGVLTVSPYEVSVVTTTSKETMTYGDEAPVFAFEYVGENRFFEDDGIVITATADKEIKNVGEYTVIVTGYNDNYIVNMDSATFEITPKKINIVSAEIVGGNEFVYTGEVVAPEVRAVFEQGALVEGDSVKVAFDYFQNGVMVDAINVGTYDAVISSVDSPNYELIINEGQELPSTTFTIIAREVSIVVNDAQREYGIADITPKGEAYTYNTDVTFVQSDIDSGRLVIELVSEVDITAGATDYPESVSIVISGEAAENYSLQITGLGTLTVTGTNISSIELVENETVYTGGNLIGKIAFNVAEGVTGFAYKVTSDAEGLNVIDEIVNAGTYYVTLSVDGTGSMFTGGPSTLTFVVNKAERVLKVSDIDKVVNYNKLTFDCAFENMHYKVNDGAYLNTNVFDAKALTSYKVTAKAGESDNYLESNEVTFTVKTGINPTTINSALDGLDAIDFSNIETYKSVLSQLELVGDDDKSAIDNDKLDELAESYEALLSGAMEVIGGAQSVASKASGMSAKGKISLALTTGVGIAFAGVMLSVSAKKREKDDKKKVVAKKRTKAGVIVAIIAVVTLLAVMATACVTKKFSQDDIFNLASYATDSNEKEREVVIEVKSGSTVVYKYDNGDETFADGLENEGSFSLSGKGTGFNFKAEYFENAAFSDANGTATFKADVKDVKNFLGIESATNGKVEVTADSANKKLKSVKVTYDVENGGTAYSVSIDVTMKY